MFVYSVNKRQLKLGAVIFVLAVMCIVLAVITKDSIETAGGTQNNVRASTDEERIAFLSQFGWSVDEEPVEVKEVIIPSQFDEVYEKYNLIQKNQGFDLEQYRSKRVKKWTYIVRNYKGYENSNCIRATLLVFDGNVIGGDICSVELNGFMHGFVMPAG